MAKGVVKRKLAALLSADGAGYTRLMAEDESATVKALETYREVMSTLIVQHRPECSTRSHRYAKQADLCLANSDA